MAVENMTWESVCQAIATLYGTDAQTIATTLTNNGVAVGDVEQAFKMLNDTAYQIWYNSDGTVRSYNYVGFPDAYVGGNAAGVTQLINSNAKVSTKTAVTVPLNTSPSVAEPTKVTFGAGMKQAGNFVLKEVLPAVAAANVGITLGKTIDSALYNANPDFWDSHGWGSINPETWATITQDDDSLGAKVFNTVFKIDPQTNSSQAYIDQDALAYLALVLQQLGVFADAHDTVSGEVGGYSVIEPVIAYNYLAFSYYEGTSSRNPKNALFEITEGSARIAICINPPGWSGRVYIGAGNTEPFKIHIKYGDYNNEVRTAISKVIDGITYYYAGEYISLDTNRPPAVEYSAAQTAINSGLRLSNHGYALGIALAAGTVTPGQVIEGIGTQSGATTPQLDNDDTVAEVLAKLQAQYPDLFSNAVTQDVIQPDGSVKTYTYVPVAQSVTEDGLNPDTQPISGNSTQVNPEVDPEASTESQLAYIIGLLTDLANSNLENTGEGNTPSVVIPTGTASALFSVYNPSQSEINSFGGWLWSSNFVDQLLKMFNDPMQAIISLHKVFCTPSISGRDDIKVGYLNSGVEANVVDEQYVDVDCGTIQLTEVFQNVFDYPPFTEVSLYLPFIGFVKLDVNDIMRGTMQVIYHVDVLTGACLADVKVTRDMFGGVIYQYNGDCSVHYPLSSGSYMGMVTAALGVAGTIASGGSVIPMLLGVAKAKTSVERSGNLSGNAGAMGIKKPYLVIQRPQTSTANEFNKYLGKPANFTTKIGSATGYISCTEVHIENCNGTDSELAELESLLKSGILI